MSSESCETNEKQYEALEPTIKSVSGNNENTSLYMKPLRFSIASEEFTGYSIIDRTKDRTVESSTGKTIYAKHWHASTSEV